MSDPATRRKLPQPVTSRKANALNALGSASSTASRMSSVTEQSRNSKGRLRTQQERQERRACELRANLKRRKAKAACGGKTAGMAGTTGTPDGEDEPPAK